MFDMQAWLGVAVSLRVLFNFFFFFIFPLSVQLGSRRVPLLIVVLLHMHTRLSQRVPDATEVRDIVRPSRSVRAPRDPAASRPPPTHLTHTPQPRVRGAGGCARYTPTTNLVFATGATRTSVTGGRRGPLTRISFHRKSGETQRGPERRRCLFRSLGPEFSERTVQFTTT